MDINKYQEFKYLRSYAKLPKISFLQPIDMRKARNRWDYGLFLYLLQIYLKKSIITTRIKLYYSLYTGRAHETAHSNKPKHYIFKDSPIRSNIGSEMPPSRKPDKALGSILTAAPIFNIFRQAVLEFGFIPCYTNGD